MTFESSISLVAELERLMKGDRQELQEDIDRLQRFHLHLTQRTDYGPFLLASLQQGRQSTIVGTLVCAEYLGYLVNFCPQWEEALETERGLYLGVLAAGVLFSKEAQSVYAMLMKDDSISLLEEIKRRIADLTEVSYLPDVEALIDVLSQKIVWEMKKRSSTRPRPHPAMQRFMDQVVTYLCSKEYGGKEEILMRLFRLMGLAFQYLRQDVAAYKTMILLLMEYWLSLKLFKKEVKEQLFKTLTVSLESLGIYKEELFFQFFNAYLSHLEDIQYLRLLGAFLNKLDKSKRLNQPQLEKILKQLIPSVLRVPDGPLLSSYHSKSLIIDLIINISSFYGCDMSKVLTQQFPHARNASHQALIGSLMPIFDQRVSAETIRCIEQQKRHEVQKQKQNKKYYAALKYYCNQEMDFEELVMNPELTGDFLWEFLMLRTTVAKNYGALCEIDQVVNFVINLIKFALLGIYSVQCLEIIEKVIQKDSVYSLKQLENISYSSILMSLKPILKKQVENMSQSGNEKFSCLFFDLRVIIQLISSKYKVEELSGLRLFEAVIMFSNELSRQYVTPALMKHLKQLLQAVMPVKFQKINEGDLKRCLGHLLTHQRQTGSISDFFLYLEIMSRGVNQKHLQNVFKELNSDIQKILHQREDLDQILEDSYKINFYMLRNLPFEFQILQNCWGMFMKMPSDHYPQYYFNIFDLFRYFARLLKNGGDEVDFLLYQMRMTEEVMVSVDRMIIEAQVLQRVEKLLIIKQGLLRLLQEILQRYYELRAGRCEELTSIHAYLYHAYQDMKNSKYLGCSFEDRPAIRKNWCNCQLLVLFLVVSAMSSDWPAERSLIATIMEIDEKVQWVSMLYPKNHEQQLHDYSLLINSNMFKLKYDVLTKLASTNHS